VQLLRFLIREYTHAAVAPLQQHGGDGDGGGAGGSGGGGGGG